MKNKLKIIFLLILLTSGSLAKAPMKRGESVFRKGDFPLQINGYEEYEFNYLDTSGDSQQYLNDARYSNLPSSVKVYSGLRHRRLLDIEGQIAEDLYVRYKIYQEPDMPDEIEIYVEYDRWSIYFGEFDAIIQNGQMVNIVKGLDGFQFEWQEKDWDLTFINGQEKSHARDFSFSGNGQMTYSLGQQNILQGSVIVYLNDQRLSESSYTIDYFDGTIKFDRILSSLDRIRGEYQYSDPIEDFLPISSKVSFTGLKHKFKKFKEPDAIFQTKDRSFQLKPKDEKTIAPIEYQQAFNKGTAYYYDQDYQQIEPSQLSNRGNYYVTIEGDDFLETYRVELVSQIVTETISVTTSEVVMSEGISPSITENIVTNIVTRNKQVKKSSLVDFIILPQFNLRLNKEVFSRQDQLVAVISRASFIEALPTADFADGTVTFNRSGQDYRLIRQLKELSDGQNYFYINYQGERYKVPFYLKPESQSIKTIQLDNNYIIPFTEEVLVNNNKLEAKWYSIDYQTGLVSFFNELPASSKVTVNYDHYLVNTRSDSFYGDDKKGPYQLDNRYLVERSVTIKINGITLIDRATYEIDYKKGIVEFSRKIGKNEKIDIEYSYHLLANQTQVSNPEQLFSAESFYVKESARSAEGDNTETNTASGSELNVSYDGTRTIILLPAGTVPVLPGSEEITIDGTPTTDYEIEEYRGYITVTGNYSSSAIVVNYTYYKSSLGPKEYFTGNDVLGSYIELDMIYPIVYDSDIELKVYRGDTGTYEYLQYKKNFIIGRPEDLIGIDGEYAKVTYNEEAWKRGIITFVTPNSGHTNYSVISNWPYDETDSFTLTYYTSNSDKPESGDVIHEMYGTNISFKPAEYMDVNLEMVKSIKEYQRAVDSYRSEYNGSGVADTTYNLDKPAGVTNLEVVEDSERVYVNGVLLTQLEDYYLEYNGGVLRFRNNRVIGTDDLIVVEYDYYSSAGTSEKIFDSGDAIKLDTMFDFDKVKAGFSYVTVNEDFDSLGSLPYASGSQAKAFNISYQPDQKLTMTAKLEDQQVKNGSYEEDSTAFVYQDKLFQNYSLDYSFLRDGKLNLRYRRDDVSEPTHKMASNNYLVDTTEMNYEARMSIGPETFKNSFYMTNQENFTDVLDRENETRTYVRKYGLANTWKPLGDMSLTTKFDRNHDDEHKEYRKRSMTEAFSEVFNYTPWVWTFNANYNISNYLTEQSSTADYYTMERTLGQDINNFYSIAFKEPREWELAVLKNFYSRYSKKDYINRSTLSDQAPNTEREEKYTISGLPFDFASIGWDSTFKTWKRQDNLDYKHYKADTYSFKSWYPFKWLNPFKIFKEEGLIVETISYSHNRDYNVNNVQSGSRLGTTRLSFNDQYEQKYSIPLMDNLKLSYQRTDSYDDDTTEERYDTGISETLKDNRDIDYSYILNYTQNNLYMFRSFTFDWTRKNSIYDRISQTKSAGSTTYNKTVDVDDQLTDSGLMKYSWDRFDFQNSITRRDQLYSQTDSGSRYSYGQTDVFLIKYLTPIKGLNLRYNWDNQYNIQYTNPESDKSYNFLKHYYEEFLYKIDNTQRLGLDYTPMTKFTVDGSVYWQSIFQDLKEVTATTNQKTHLTIDSTSLEAGLRYIPVDNMSVRYGIRKYFYESGDGSSDTFTLSYQLPYFDKFTYYYENTISYGKGANVNEQEFSEKEQQGYVLTRVVDRNDIRTSNKLEIDITKSIKNLVTDKLVVKVYLNHFKLFDRINLDYNYSVNAFYAKGTIQF